MFHHGLERLGAPGLALTSTTRLLKTLSGNSMVASHRVVGHIALRSKDHLGYQLVRLAAYFHLPKWHLKVALPDLKILAHLQVTVVGLKTVARVSARSRLSPTQAHRKVQDHMISDPVGLRPNTRACSAEISVQDRVGRLVQPLKAGPGNKVSPPRSGLRCSRASRKTLESSPGE